MKTRSLLGVFLLSIVTFCVSACQDDAEIVLFSGSQIIDEPGTCGNVISAATLYLNGRPNGDIGIANGKGGYQARSSDETVVTATISNDRLLLSSNGKKGKAIITIKDKKDNSVSLPVTVSYGIVTLYCQDENFAISVDNIYYKDDVLQKQVNEEMKRFFFMKKEGKCILQPDDITNFLDEGSGGSFIVYAPDGKESIKGEYEVKWDNTLTGKENIAFIFSYNGERHTFFYNPKLGYSPTARATGPTPFLLVEDMTSLCSPTITLPENGKVLYVVYTSSWGTRPAE